MDTNIKSETKAKAQVCTLSLPLVLFLHPASILAPTIPSLCSFISSPSQQHLLIQALHDELEEAAKGEGWTGGQEGGQSKVKGEEDEEKFWANVAAEEQRCV